ncbi:MAG: TetR/AcrR family transcriptional regulator [Desulfatibacillaceae bacterium]
MRKKDTGQDTAPKTGEAGEPGMKERILAAARTVFSRHPYNAASLRMIGKEGGFFHPHIRYYFPTKARLFEAVVLECCRQYYDRNHLWLQGLDATRPEDGLSMYMDRLFEYHVENPEPLRIIMQNIVRTDTLESIPGYRHIPEVFSRIRQTFLEKIPLAGSPEEISMFFDGFNAVVINYLGASSCHAQYLGMDPEGEEYRAWVKQCLMHQFLPWLKRLAGQGRSAADADSGRIESKGTPARN